MAKQAAKAEETREARVAKVLERARAAEQRGDRAGALKALDEAQADLRAFGSWHYARGAMLVRDGRLDAGIEALREAARRDPDLGEVLANLGGTLVDRARRAGPGKPVNARDLAEGTKILEKAADLDPKLPSARSSLGLAYQLAGRLEEAVAVLAKELERSPTDATTLYNQAAALAQLGRRDAAKATLERLLAAHPDHGPARTSLANLGK